MEVSYLLLEVLGSGWRKERTVRELLGGFEGLRGAAGSITGFRRYRVKAYFGVRRHRGDQRRSQGWRAAPEGQQRLPEGRQVKKNSR